MKMKGSMVMDKLDKIYEICAEHFKEMPCSIQYVPIKYLNEEYPDIFHPERLLNTGHTDSSSVPHKPSVHRLW